MARVIIGIVVYLVFALSVIAYGLFKARNLNEKKERWIDHIDTDDWHQHW